MKIVLVTDANPILSALLGGAARSVFFDNRFRFVTTEFTVQEVVKYLPRVAKKSKVPVKLIEEALDLLPLEIYSKKVYQTSLPLAHDLMSKIDPKDVDILSLYLHYNTFLWTHDKHFYRVQYSLKLVATFELLP